MMYPEYVTIVVGNQKEVVAYRLSFYDTLFTVGLVASIPVALVNKSKILPVFIVSGFGYLSRKLHVIKG